MSEASDMILPLLREMRAENTQHFNAIETRLDRMDARYEKIEAQLVSFRHALTADSLMSKLVTGDFEERIEALEGKTGEFEGRR